MENTMSDMQEGHQELADDRRRAKSSPAPTKPQEDYDEITYVPRDSGDPIYTIVGHNPEVPSSGIRFTANVPVKVKRSQTMMQLLRQDHEMPDGTFVSRAVERKVPYAKVLEGNPSFSINGVRPEKKEPSGLRQPTTHNEYRSYAIDWIAGSSTAREMEVRWEGEQHMRDICGVDAQDLKHISPFYEARIGQLRGTARVERATASHPSRV